MTIGMRASGNDRSDAAALRAASADPEQFRLVYDRHAPAVWRFIRAQVAADLAEDLTAETFAVALRRRGDYVPHGDSARGWLLGIASNLIRASRRSNARGARALLRLPRPREASVDIALERLDAADARRPLLVALARISQREREVLLLSAIGGLAYDEIAVVLGVPIGTVRSRLHRARESMRAALPMKEEP
jgi:RNA polymerase sigma-70 factor (ECF subfamily)